MGSDAVDGPMAIIKRNSEKNLKKQPKRNVTEEETKHPAFHGDIAGLRKTLFRKINRRFREPSALHRFSNSVGAADKAACNCMSTVSERPLSAVISLFTSPKMTNQSRGGFDGADYLEAVQLFSPPSAHKRFGRDVGWQSVRLL
jgi:hypothetical protein